MNNTKIKLTLETENFKQSWESPNENEDLESLCYAFFSLCTSSGWSPLDIYKEMFDFSEFGIKNLKSSLKKEEHE